MYLPVRTCRAAICLHTVIRSDPYGNMHEVEGGDEFRTYEDIQYEHEKCLTNFQYERDRRNFDIHNTDPQKVLDAYYYSAYEGVVYFKVEGNAGTSFGIVFLGRGVTSTDVVKHERGHVEQLFQLGMPGYLVCVAIPSVIHYWLYDWDRFYDSTYYNYYSMPMEYGANLRGNVSMQYDEWADVAYFMYNLLEFAYTIC